MRKLFLFTLLFCLCGSLAWGAAAVDSPNVVTGETGGVANFTLPVTTSGSNRALVCALHAGPSNPSASYNSASMTNLGEADQNNRTVTVFALSNPTVGTNDLFTAPASGNFDIILGCVPLTGAHQTTASLTGTPAEENDVSINGASLTITIPADGLGLSFIIFNRNGDCSTANLVSGQTEIYDLCNSIQWDNIGASYSTTSGSVNFTWDPIGDYGSMFAVPINAAAVASGRIIIVE
jgi:hypothetical protein